MHRKKREMHTQCSHTEKKIVSIKRKKIVIIKEATGLHKQMKKLNIRTNKERKRSKMKKRKKQRNI